MEGRDKLLASISIHFSKIHSGLEKYHFPTPYTHLLPKILSIILRNRNRNYKFRINYSHMPKPSKRGMS